MPLPATFHVPAANPGVVICQYSTVTLEGRFVADASTFTITVLNGTNYADRDDEGTARGLIDPAYVEVRY